MKNIKKQVERSIEKEIEFKKGEITRVKNSPINLIAECFPQARYTKYDNEIDFWLPFQFELIQVVKDFMAMHTDYRMSSERRDVGENAIHTVKYSCPGLVRIEFYFSTAEEGTTCVLNQIGTKMIEAHEQPIFEVICTKGAEEGSF